MATAYLPSHAQELINAIAILRRDERLGEKQCRRLQRALEERKEMLNALADQAVRLVGLMGACAGGSYVDFLYLSLSSVRLGRLYPVLHADHFRILVLRTHDEGRLSGLFRVDGDGVDFLKSSQDLRGRSYRLDFNAMPLAAGFLELFLNAAELDEIEAIVGPLQGGAGDNLLADDRSGFLRNWLDQWLKGRAWSEHYTRQAQAFRDFLQGLSEARVTFRREIVAGATVELAEVAFPASIRAVVAGRSPKKVARAAVSQAQAAEMRKPLEADELARMRDDFYRRQAGNGNETAPAPAGQSLSSASTPVQPHDAGPAAKGASSRFDGCVLETVPVNEFHRLRWPAAYAAFALGAAVTVSEPEWREGDLGRHVSDETIMAFWSEVNRDAEFGGSLKMKKYRTVARQFLDYRTSLRLSAGRSNPDEGMSLTRGDGTEAEYEIESTVAWSPPLASLLAESAVNWMNKDHAAQLGHVIAASFNDQSALFVDSYPNLAFARTLLRYIHFGNLQERAIKGSLVVGEDGYAGVVSEFAAIGAWLRDLAHATGYALMLRDNAFALNLLETLQPGIIDDLKIGTVIRSRGDDLTAAIRLARPQMTDKANPVGKRFRECHDAINRAGFRKTDLGIPEFDLAFARGAEHLPLVIEVLDDVMAWLADLPDRQTPAQDPAPRSWLAPAEAADKARFAAIFARMYAPALATTGG